jgi:hypothetical protein
LGETKINGGFVMPDRNLRPFIGLSAKSLGEFLGQPAGWKNNFYEKTLPSTENFWTDMNQTLGLKPPTRCQSLSKPRVRKAFANGFFDALLFFRAGTSAIDAALNRIQ